MTTFTKLFSSILTSTVWQESKEVKLLWVTMLASCDRWGVVEASVPGLAHIAMLTMAETEAALHVLSSPDAHSRTKEHEGRRIEAIDGGWKLLNHHKYRDRASAVDRQEYNRVKQAESRTRREKEKPGSCQPMSNDVNKCQTLSKAVNRSQQCQHIQIQIQIQIFSLWFLRHHRGAKRRPGIPSPRSRPPTANTGFRGSWAAGCRQHGRRRNWPH